MKKLALVLGVALTMVSCTENVRARHFGGTEEIAMKPNEILLNVTWKDSQMWILTKDTVTGVSYFREKSSWGVLEGTIIIK